MLTLFLLAWAIEWYSSGARVSSFSNFCASSTNKYPMEGLEISAKYEINLSGVKTKI